MSNTNDPVDPIPDEVDKGLALAYGRGSPPAPQLSVLAQIAGLTGAQPSITLREPEDSGDSAMLRPLGTDKRVEAGKYVVQGELGRGGVGAVHKAHDQDLGRDVAMKFLHERYKDEPSIMHRFVEEAQIGGQLQHPGIVPVYDLGMVDGKPFFAMKLVKGATLAKKLSDRTSMTTDRHALLSIFEQVCQTMAYAHARGVVHRDLKPANIMIGSFGEVQVVDWGMGKVLQQGGVADEQRSIARQAELSIIETSRSAGHGTQSIMGSVMGTPADMPPEQARGDVDAMDERSDVFALGAILCEILTGLPPYLGRQSNELIAMAAMCKLDDANARLAACDAEPELVELAQVCMMPAPAARPKSAEQVAAKVRGYLDATANRVHDARVEAAEAKVRVAGLKRTAIVGSTLTVFIAIGLAASLWLWQEAEAQREQADKQREQADLTADFMSGILEGAGPLEAQGRDTEMLKAMLDDAAQRVKDGELEGNVEAELQLRSTIGRAYSSLAAYPDAETMLQGAMVSARYTYDGDHETKTRATFDLATLALERGELAKADDLSRAALEMRQRLFPGDHRDVAASLQQLGIVYMRRRDHAEAKPLFVEALAMRESLAGGEDDREVVRSRTALVHALQNTGELDEAERHMRDAEAMTRRLFDGDHIYVATNSHLLGNLLVVRGRPAEAEPYMRDALAMSRRLFPSDHPAIATILGDTAYPLILQEKFADAEALLREALAILDRLGQGQKSLAAGVRAMLAFTLTATGDLDEAETLLRECVTIREDLAPDLWRTFFCKSQLGEVLLGQGKPEKLPEAEQLLLEGYRGMKQREARIPPGGRMRMSQALERLVKFYEATDNETEAAKWRIELDAERAKLNVQEAVGGKR